MARERLFEYAARVAAYALRVAALGLCAAGYVMLGTESGALGWAKVGAGVCGGLAFWCVLVSTEVAE